MIKITRNYEMGDKVNVETNKFVVGDTNRRALEVHASDLLWCVRQSFYKKTAPKPLTQYEIQRFLKGKLSEYAMGRFIFKEDHYLQQAEVESDGIMAHPDILSHEEDLVVELKQTDKEFGFVDPRDELYNSFISYSTQLLYYMYLSKKKKGGVLVNHGNYEKIVKLVGGEKKLDPKDLNPFRHWDIEIDDEDFEVIGKDIHFKKGLLEKAIEKNNVAFLPKLITIDMLDTSKCTKCAYRSQCDKEPDYWERLRYDRIMAERARRFNIPIEQLTLVEGDYKEFKTDYDEAQMPQTATSYLYKTMKKEFGYLGKHYKVEFKRKK